MMLLVLAVLSIVGVFMLSATVNYYSNQFRSQVGAVFTTSLLSEMNSAADSTQETAVAQISTRWMPTAVRSASARDGSTM